MRASKSGGADPMKREVTITIGVEVEIDEAKFTPEFMQEFRRSLYNFRCIEDHVEHLGQLAARGILPLDFIEGYGAPADFGIKTKVVFVEPEIVPS